ncbi:MAG: glycosyltransferase [Chitinophagales bacterium]|nr:glycosyltransferase [Chitinophagales bacterium]
MEGPLVSIITPTYNHARFLDACIQSALNQTYLNWEMIIVNDGSTDNTEHIAKAYTTKDSRIKLFTQKNKGAFKLVETYNFALDNTNGKYIAILEGDDLWESQKLELQIKALETDENIVLTWGRAKVIDADQTKIDSVEPDMHETQSILFDNTPAGNLLKVLYFRNCIPALTIVIRKFILLQIGGFKSGKNLPLIDYPTILELSLKGKFYFDEAVLGAWRTYGNQVTKKFTVEIFKGLAACAIDHYKKNKNNDIVSQIDFNSIERSWDNLILIAYARSGRYKLLRKDFSGARKDYLKSILAPGLTNVIWRARSAVGFVFSLFRLNVEGFAKILGKKSYKI